MQLQLFTALSKFPNALKFLNFANRVTFVASVSQLSRCDALIVDAVVTKLIAQDLNVERKNTLDPGRQLEMMYALLPKAC